MNPTITKWTYNWLHITTGRTGTRESDEMTWLKFLEELNTWNRLGIPLWVYWA